VFELLKKSQEDPHLTLR